MRWLVDRFFNVFVFFKRFFTVFVPFCDRFFTVSRRRFFSVFVATDLEKKSLKNSWSVFFATKLASRSLR